MGKPDLRRRALLALGVVAALSEWTAAAAQGFDVDQYRNRVVALINAQRALGGLPPLRQVALLQRAAQTYSELMMKATAGGPVYLSHTGPDGSSLAGRVTATGYDWYTLGEDLGAGQKTPEQVFGQWMTSSEHRGNILNPDFDAVGVGIAVGPGTWSGGQRDPQVIWWTVDFGQGVDGPDPPGSAPPPSSAAISGYHTLDGTPVIGAPFGSLILINGQNLGATGSVAFHGQPTSAISWSPTSILAIVPLQFSYPDTGPVTVTMPDQIAMGPSFTTQQPGSPALQSPVSIPTVVPPASAWPPAGSLGSLPAPSAPPPSIRELADGAGRPLLSAGQGQLMWIHGSGFGTNVLRQSRVLFITPSGPQKDGAVWAWSDSSITLFAPFASGPVQVVVQVISNGTSVASNRVPLTMH